MVETILTSTILSQFIFPWVLIFTLIFAILDKTKITGENKQVNAIISFAIATIFIVVKPARDAIANLVPILAVFAVVLLMFMILYGFVLQGEIKIEGMLRNIILVVIISAIAVAVLMSTGFWSTLKEFILSEKGFVINLFILVVIGAAVYLTLKFKE